MQRFAQTCDAIAATSKKTQKVALVAEYFLAAPKDEAAQAAIFLSGRAFAGHEETTLQVGGSLLWRAVAEVSGAGEAALTMAYRRHGDLGAAAAEVWGAQGEAADPARAGPKAEADPVTVMELAEAFRKLAQASGPAAKLEVVKGLLERASAAEAKYMVKIMGGELRIGLRESLVEEAIAKAYGVAFAQVQRANMLLGDIGETLRLGAEARLAEARMRLFHPIGFMLASPVETAAEAFETFDEGQVEDKYDGIRAQVHYGGESGADPHGVRIFSRTLDDVTASFPELAPGFTAFEGAFILDGEVVAWESAMATDSKTERSKAAKHQGRARPFADLQKRLGRKKVTEAMLREIPVVFQAFDVIFSEAHGGSMLDKPLRERMAVLDAIFAERERRLKKAPLLVPRVQVKSAPQGALAFESMEASEPPRILRAPVSGVRSAEELEQLFEKARERGNEGLMIKDMDSAYAPGRRGKAWLKMKRELATLDVVVTAAEFGHGKRAAVLSDYTFAVRDGERLLNVGKAYSGLTDVEIADLTRWFLQHTLVDEGYRRIVDPEIVLEVAFNNMMRSERHESGYALRFPRILRIRLDKSAKDIDTLERVREIFEQQGVKPAG